jgi:hypothetical protein
VAVPYLSLFWILLSPSLRIIIIQFHTHKHNSIPQCAAGAQKSCTSRWLDHYCDLAHGKVKSGI